MAKESQITNKKCKSVVKNSKLESNSDKYKKWWNKLFEELEDSVRESPNIQEHEVRKLINDDTQIYKSVCEILFSADLKNKQMFVTKNVLCKKEVVKVSKRKKKEVDVDSGDSMDVLPGDEESSISKRSQWASSIMASTIDDSDDNESETEWDLETEQGSEILDNINNYYRTEDALALDNFVNKEKRLSRRLTSRTDAGFDFDEYIPPEEEKKKYPEKNYYKMYKKFFLQPPEKAAIWRPRPPLTYDEMTLIQKADYVSERIAIDFIAWMKEINQDYNITLTPENLMSMFEIGSQNTLAKTLDMKMKEIPTLPPKIALSKKMPHLSNNAKLAKEIRLDIVASKRQPRIFAFSSRLPAEELIRPQLSDIAAKWHKSENVREDIVSMEVVWKGITHLRSTKEFSNYLQTAKPHVPHPEYLVRKGVFERLSGSDASSESNTSSSS